MIVSSLMGSASVFYLGDVVLFVVSNIEYIECLEFCHHREVETAPYRFAVGSGGVGRQKKLLTGPCILDTAKDERMLEGKGSTFVVKVDNVYPIFLFELNDYICCQSCELCAYKNAMRNV